MICQANNKSWFRGFMKVVPLMIRLHLIPFLTILATVPLMAENLPVVPDAQIPVAQLFPLDEVQLLPGFEKTKQDQNFAYLLSLDPDRFLVNFRIPAGLPVTAKPYGGWESTNGFCRGHFAGHYLSACAEAFAVTGDVRYKAKCDQMVAGLAECQKASKDGYLFTCKEIVFQNLLYGTPVPKGEPTARVPFYTLHKILTGLLDAYRYTGNEQALAIAKKMADLTSKQLSACTPKQLDQAFHTDHFVPSNEFGGMAEVLYNLYAYTGNADYLKTAKLFDREWFLTPLSLGQDILAGLHANCHLPQVLGALRDYELTGKASYKAVASNTWHMLIPGRTFNDGGSSGYFSTDRKKTPYGEHWSVPGTLSQTMGIKMSESCVAHNLLRLTSGLFSLAPSPEFADYYERTYFNTVLGTMATDQPGYYVYSTPLVPYSRKDFGSPEGSFWCCYGTGVEAFSKLANPIYYHSITDLWVNLYVPSELNWKEQGFRLTQATQFPFQDTSTFTIHTAQPKDLALHFFISEWTSKPELTINGKPLDLALTPGTFADIHQTWHDGDVITLHLPMHLRTERLEPGAKQVAVFYGPVMLTALTDSPKSKPGAAKSSQPIDLASPIPATPLADIPSHFSAAPVDDKLSFDTKFGAATFHFVPLFSIGRNVTYTAFIDSPLK